VVIQQDDAKKPLPRYEQGAAMLGHTLYVLGGHYGEQGLAAGTLPFACWRDTAEGEPWGLVLQLWLVISAGPAQCIQLHGRHP
jgi:hypothetical protein